MRRLFLLAFLLAALGWLQPPRLAAQQTPCRKVNKFATHIIRTTGVDTVSKRPRRDEPRSDVRTAANGCKRPDDPRGQKADGTKGRAEMMLTRGVMQAGAAGVSLARSVLEHAAPARRAGWS
jgi:hypothetical protein